MWGPCNSYFSCPFPVANQTNEYVFLSLPFPLLPSPSFLFSSLHLTKQCLNVFGYLEKLVIFSAYFCTVIF